MPLPRHLLEAMQAERDAAEAAAERDLRRDLVRAVLEAWGWVLLGLALVGWAFHTTSPSYGRAAFWAGIAVGNGGWLWSMLALYRRRERRGDL
jgi:hypothetical protein